MTVRLYQPVWERIKDKGTVTIEVIPPLVRRVKKAVIKEKDMDLGFKVINDNDYLFLRISYNKDKKHLTFVLKQRLGLEEVRK